MRALSIVLYSMKRWNGSNRTSFLSIRFVFCFIYSQLQLQLKIDVWWWSPIFHLLFFASNILFFRSYIFPFFSFHFFFRCRRSITQWVSHMDVEWWFFNAFRYIQRFTGRWTKICLVRHNKSTYWKCVFISGNTSTKVTYIVKAKKAIEQLWPKRKKNCKRVFFPPIWTHSDLEALCFFGRGFECLKFVINTIMVYDFFIFLFSFGERTRFMKWTRFDTTIDISNKIPRIYFTD